MMLRAISAMTPGKMNKPPAIRPPRVRCISQPIYVASFNPGEAV
jgi:hypothetical protein